MKIDKDILKGFLSGFIFVLLLISINTIIAINNNHYPYQIISGNFTKDYSFKGNFIIDNPIGLTIQGSAESGTITISSSNEIPNGWFECDGRSLNRNEYQNLFNSIGTIYGNDSSTTFKLPDLRGEFVRGFDNGRGVDSGRIFGSFQNHQFQIHKHSISHNAHTGRTVYSGNDGTKLRHWTSTASITIGNPNSGNHGAETRPRNVALKYIIKI